MNALPETPAPEYNIILTGHYRWTWASTWRSHGTNDWLLIYTVGGLGRIGFRSGEIRAEAGDAVLFHPGTLHDYGKSPGAPVWEILWAHFHPRPETLEWLEWPEVAPGLMRLRFASEEDRRWLRDRLLEVHRRTVGTRRRKEAFAMNALEEVLLHCDERNPAAGSAGIDPRVRKAMDQISSRLKDPPTREALAEASGLSASRLSHLFREQTGMSLQEYQERQRMDRAMQLLAYSPLTIQAIAEEVGYASPFYFTLRFKRRTGMNPRDYRKNAARPTE